MAPKRKHESGSSVITLPVVGIMIGCPPRKVNAHLSQWDTRPLTYSGVFGAPEPYGRCAIVCARRGPKAL